MKRVCAWCGRELKQAKPSETDESTHGICTECRFKHFDPDEGKKETLGIDARANRDGFCNG